MTNYLITGANGGYGRAVIDYLQTAIDKENIFSLVRSEEKGKALKEAGIQIRIGDYTDKDSLLAAFKGIDKVLLVSGVPGNRQAEHQNVIDAAVAAGVSYMAYTSLAGADTVAKDFALGDDHRYTEAALKASGLAFTSLRNNWYLENEMPLILPALTSGKLVYGANADSKVAWVSRKDLAEAGAKVLLADRPQEILELSGQSLAYPDLAAALSQATGKDMVAEKGSLDDVVAALVAGGFPEQAAPDFAGLQAAIAENYLDAQSSDLEAILGRPATPVVESLRTLLEA
ncbi:NAD(P)H dehydrogenase (quinone) [Streptococcus gallinaceus]|uniref:SDR family oxidoreductase n=1 Tax=Streptococcus gallinaceus TaxID=165758 RepID=UPI00209E1BD3|nr:SDR family oxidoreductase [Streptococcus gallinaceus]MCP1639621.1 NAD(P)H dehydrogenase (quinone) [Streptococcus gallinaceus]MCP1770404.1 NAD(P)H dehydrogenase (quinone) [Streptococcus gallinaceus]